MKPSSKTSRTPSTKTTNSPSQSATQTTPTKTAKNKFVSFYLFLTGILILIASVAYTLLTQDALNSPSTSQDKLILSDHPEPSELNISRQCAQCHPEVFKNWSGSHHAWAQRKIATGPDAPAFQRQNLNAHGENLIFRSSRNNENIEAKTPFTIECLTTQENWAPLYVVGKTPLVQYLILKNNGAYQCTSAAWDVTQKEWFDMFGTDSRTSKDWGHWRNRGMTWNSQCAWCHTTHFKKNYNTETHTYNSTWVESGVSCIQCHKLHPNHKKEANGCLVEKLVNLSNKQQNDNCATCHARREEVDDSFTIGDRFDDHFVLNLPTQDGLWWPNGMQRDEVYTETGLKLSRMGHAGIQCLDCHQSHTAKTIEPVEDNSLCLKCHKTGERKAPIIDPTAHSHHQPNSEGNKCVNCHAPRATYMARDPRRDHSFTSPDPELSKELGIPNACLNCHNDKNIDWVIAETKKWYGDLPKTGLRDRKRTRSVHHALKGTLNSPASLIQVLEKEENTTWRATLLTLLEDYITHPDYSHKIAGLATQSAKSTNSLERLAAARILTHHRSQTLIDLLTDPVKTVRIQTAWALKDVLPENHLAMKELEASALHQADQPSGAMKLAQIYTHRANQEEKKNNALQAQKHIQTAQSWYEKAIEWDPTSSVILRDYAIFLAGLNQQKEARTQLQKAIDLQPQTAHYHYLLALSFAEDKLFTEALNALSNALMQDPNYIQAYYNRALIYNQNQQLDKALIDLDKAHSLQPQNPQYLYTKAILLYQAKKLEDYRRTKQQALNLFPQNPDINALP